MKSTWKQKAQKVVEAVKSKAPAPVRRCDCGIPVDTCEFHSDLPRRRRMDKRKPWIERRKGWTR